MNDFYLTVMSNSHENDKIGDFKSILPNCIHLGKPYEVALTTLIYPATHDVITNAPDVGSLFNENELFLTTTNGIINITIPSSSFNNGKELIDLLNFTIKHKFSTISNETTTSKITLFNYQDVTKRCIVNKTDVIRKVQMSKKIAYLLGLPDIIEKFPKSGDFSVSCGTDFMFIYLNNIVEPQICSNTKVPLIKVLSLPPGNGENVEISFAKPHYVPVRPHEFDNIHVQLKNDRNHVIPFNSGKVAMVLHFRRRRSFITDEFY